MGSRIIAGQAVSRRLNGNSMRELRLSLMEQYREALMAEAERPMSHPITDGRSEGNGMLLEELLSFECLAKLKEHARYERKVCTLVIEWGR